MVVVSRGLLVMGAILVSFAGGYSSSDSSNFVGFLAGNDAQSVGNATWDGSDISTPDVRWNMKTHKQA